AGRAHDRVGRARPQRGGGAELTKAAVAAGTGSPRLTAVAFAAASWLWCPRIRQPRTSTSGHCAASAELK
ncbi:MAG TPA: hypothetical protein VE197_14405, partial [Mycobacterium sp.]|nr:hypothetical protein [Mycobacterium sp.]